MEIKHEISVGDLIVGAVIIFFIALVLLEIVYFENKMAELVTLVNHLIELM